MAGDKAKPAKLLELFAQFFDGHDSEHIPAAHAAGRFERRSRAPYDLFRNAGERAGSPQTASATFL